MRKSFICALLAIVGSWSALADVKLPAIFGDNMVLQSGQPVAVWGWAAPSEEVTVSVGDQKKSAAAGADGKWRLKLDPIAAAGPVDVTIAGKNSITLKNVLVGDVWVCSGQSNMGFGFNGAHNAEVERPKAEYPKIRLFTVKRKTSFTPVDDVEGKWVECSPETVGTFSAVAYFFGRDLHKALGGAPVGLIHTSWGGTPAEAWTSMEVLRAEPALKPYVDRRAKFEEGIDAATKKWETETFPKWQAAQKQWEEEVGKSYRAALAKWNKDKTGPMPTPAKQAPRRPESPKEDPHYGAVLYNAMIHPLIPLSIKGAIWYQGESNAGQPGLYRTLFPAMIKDWRTRWGEGDFPFVWVQLANFQRRESEPTQTEGGWPGLREAQSMTLALPNTGQAVIIDIGESNDIHPKNKDTVGQRLALSALKVAYGKDVVFSGPTYENMSVERGKVRVKFKNVGDGLVIGASPPIRLGQEAKKPADRVVGFAIAGEDKKFVWANATIEGGDTVVVSSDAVAKPAAVRYAWANDPECNLYNKEGLPASPFRTDDWVAPVPAKK